MNKLILKKLETLAEQSPIAAYVDLYMDASAEAEAVLYANTPYQGNSEELDRRWVRTVGEMKALLVEWEAELDKRGIVR